MQAKIAERGQVTIPKALRDRLGLKPGMTLEFIEEQGRMIVLKAKTVDPVEQIYGSLGRSRKTDDIIRELRGDS